MTIRKYLSPTGRPIVGKIFYSDGSGNARPRDPNIVPGWYYQIDLATPVGPFDTHLEAGEAAKATVSTATKDD